MIPFFSGLFTFSWTGRIVALCIAAFALWQANNLYQRHVGRTQAETKVIANTKEVARERNETSRKIRARNPVDGAAARLWAEYGIDRSD